MKFLYVKLLLCFLLCLADNLTIKNLNMYILMCVQQRWVGSPISDTSDCSDPSLVSNDTFIRYLFDCKILFKFKKIFMLSLKKFKGRITAVKDCQKFLALISFLTLSNKQLKYMYRIKIWTRKISFFLLVNAFYLYVF